MSRRHKRAVSWGLWALAAVLSALEVVLPFFSDDPPIPRFGFAILSAGAVAGAFITRALVQRSMSGDDA